MKPIEGKTVIFASRGLLITWRWKKKKHLQNNIFLTLIFLPLKTQRPSGNLATKKNHTKMKYSITARPLTPTAAQMLFHRCFRHKSNTCEKRSLWHLYHQLYTLKHNFEHVKRITTQDKTHFFPKCIAVTLIVPFNLAQIQSFISYLKELYCSQATTTKK